MKKLLLLGMVMITTTAFAFGGGGHGRSANFYERHQGVDAIGIHYHGNGGQVYFTNCPSGSSTIGLGGETGILDENNEMCKCNEANQVYTVNGCEVQPAICNDHTINQCGLGYYCEFTDEEKMQEGLSGDGTCLKASGGTEMVGYFRGTTQMNWWSAYSWCIGNGKYLLTGSVGNIPLDKFVLRGRKGTPFEFFDEGEFWTGHDDGGINWRMEVSVLDESLGIWSEPGDSTKLPLCGPVTCKDDEELIDGRCVKKCPEGVERNTDNSCTVCANGNVYLSYNADPCGTVIDDFTGCKTNKDCSSLGDNYYCDLENQEYSTCLYPTSGTCVNIGDYTEGYLTGLGAVRRSNSYMSWWAADQWCKAQGKSLIPVEKFQAYVSGTTTLITEGSGILGMGTKAACASGKTCKVWNNTPYSKMWSGNTLTDAADADGERYLDKYSPVVTDLRLTFDSNSLWLWTASNHSSENSCAAWGILLNKGVLTDIQRHFDTYGENHSYALCK